jgi:hypothetical protein
MVANPVKNQSSRQLNFGVRELADSRRGDDLTRSAKISWMSLRRAAEN